MMHSLKKLTCGLAVALPLCASAYAAPVINNWYFNPIGGGQDSAQLINEYVDVNGTSFVQLEQADTGASSFRQHGVYTVRQADSNGRLFPVDYAGGYITLTFESFGTILADGAWRYDGGTLRMYQNPQDQYGTSDGIYGANLGQQIARFALLGGTTRLADAQGRPLSNSQTRINFRSGMGMVEEGYFFDEAGQDLAHASDFGFDIALASTWTPPQDMLTEELICQFAGFAGAGCNGSDFDPYAPGRFLLSHNGIVKLIAVPEPGSLALFGIACLGAGMVRRRRAAAV